MPPMLFALDTAISVICPTLLLGWHLRDSGHLMGNFRYTWRWDHSSFDGVRQQFLSKEYVRRKLTVAQKLLDLCVYASAFLAVLTVVCYFNSLGVYPNMSRGFGQRVVVLVVCIVGRVAVRQHDPEVAKIPRFCHSLLHWFAMTLLLLMQCIPDVLPQQRSNGDLENALSLLFRLSAGLFAMDSWHALASNLTYSTVILLLTARSSITIFGASVDLFAVELITVTACVSAARFVELSVQESACRKLEADLCAQQLQAVTALMESRFASVVHLRSELVLAETERRLESLLHVATKDNTSGETPGSTAMVYSCIRGEQFSLFIKPADKHLFDNFMVNRSRRRISQDPTSLPVEVLRVSLIGTVGEVPVKLHHAFLENPFPQLEKFEHLIGVSVSEVPVSREQDVVEAQVSEKVDSMDFPNDTTTGTQAVSASRSRSMVRDWMQDLVALTAELEEPSVTSQASSAKTLSATDELTASSAMTKSSADVPTATADEEDLWTVGMKNVSFDVHDTVVEKAETFPDCAVLADIATPNFRLVKRSEGWRALTAPLPQRGLGLLDYLKDQQEVFFRVQQAAEKANLEKKENVEDLGQVTLLIPGKSARGGCSYCMNCVVHVKPSGPEKDSAKCSRLATFLLTEVTQYVKSSNHLLMNLSDLEGLTCTGSHRLLGTSLDVSLSSCSSNPGSRTSPRLSAGENRGRRRSRSVAERFLDDEAIRAIRESRMGGDEGHKAEGTSRSLVPEAPKPTRIGGTSRSLDPEAPKPTRVGGSSFAL